MPSFLPDLRFALRLLSRNLGFTAVAVLTLALGIGTTTTVLSIVHDVILAPQDIGTASSLNRDPLMH